MSYFAQQMCDKRLDWRSLTHRSSASVVDRMNPSEIKEEIHLYAKLGGGTNDTVHNPDKHVPRPHYLYFDESKARYATVVNASGGTHRIYYEIHGNGEIPVIFLMGLAGCHTQFEPQLKEFGLEKASKYTVLLVDNRGIGFSDTPVYRWKTTDFASDIVQLLMQLERSSLKGEGIRWKRNVNIVGFSMGGMIAQEAVLMDPSRFGSLTLISTHAGGLVGTIPPPHGAMPLLRTFGSLGGYQALDAGVELLFPRRHLEETIDHASTYSDITPEYPIKTRREHYAYKMIQRARKYVESNGEMKIDHRVFLQMLAVMSHYVSWDRLQAIKKWGLPVLVVSGAQDNLVSSRNSKIISETLNCKWLHFEEGGHGVSEQYIEECNSALEEHFENGFLQPVDLTRQSKPPEKYHPWRTSFLLLLALILIFRRYNLPRNVLLLKGLLVMVLLRKLYGGVLQDLREVKA